jgi:hypothetical protein
MNEKNYHDLVAEKIEILNTAIDSLEDTLISRKTIVLGKEVSMKEQLTTLVLGMKDNNYNFIFTPPVFHWEYPELPGFKFKLFITEDYDQ